MKLESILSFFSEKIQLTFVVVIADGVFVETVINLKYISVVRLERILSFL